MFGGARLADSKADNHVSSVVGIMTGPAGTVENHDGNLTTVSSRLTSLATQTAGPQSTPGQPSGRGGYLQTW
jgi:hypothetical protein